MLTLPLKSHYKQQSQQRNLPLIDKTLKHLLKTGALLLSLTCLSPALAETENDSVRLDKPHQVKDLAYGEFLFDYYQEKYFTSISKAMIAEKRGLLKHHHAQTQVLLGSLYVGYGMLDEAENIFTNLLESATARSVRNKVWYHLSEVYYKRGSYEKAINILQAHIKEPRTSLKNEIELLLAQNLIATGELKEALTHLNNIKSKKGFSQFAKFNLASAHGALDNPEKAKALYHEVLRTRSRRKDTLASALKDRAALALGTSHLKSEDWTKARASFESIKLDGPSSNTALLGLGWSYLYNDDPVGALAPWQELSRRNPSDPAVQEVLLNLPLVYEKAGALQDALNGYRAANEHYHEEFKRLGDLQKTIDESDWINSLTPPVSFSFDPLKEVGKFNLPQTALSHYLYQFYASHEFQESFRNYRELQRLKQLLNHWQKELPIFDQMIKSNIERLQLLSPKADQAVIEAQELLVSGTKKLVEFTERLNTAIAENDLTITATDNQTDLLDRLNQLEEKLAKLPNIPDYDAERERFHIIKGVLMWDLNETAIERRWERTKDKVFIEGQLALLEERTQLVIDAGGKHLTQYEGFKSRVTELDQRLKHLQEKSLRAILHHRAYLRAIAKDIIAQHQRHVKHLQANTLFSIARLQDIAYTQEQERNFQPAEEVSIPNDETSLDETQNSEDQDSGQNESSTNPEGSGALPNSDNKPRIPLEVEERKSLFEGGFKSIFGIWD